MARRSGGGRRRAVAVLLCVCLALMPAAGALPPVYADSNAAPPASGTSEGAGSVPGGSAEGTAEDPAGGTVAGSAGESAGQTAGGTAGQTAGQSSGAAGSGALSGRYTYTDYLAEHGDAPRDVTAFTADAGTGFSDNITVSGDGTEGVRIADGEAGEFRFTVPATGLYNIRVRYVTEKGKDSALQWKLYLDGEQPFFEAGQLTLFRYWTDGEAPGALKDALGNDRTPPQEEIFREQEAYLEDHTGKYAESFLFYLTAGEHTLRYVSVKEPVTVTAFSFLPERVLPTYEEALAGYRERGLEEVRGEFVSVPAEKPSAKSDPTLYARNDRASPATKPSSSRYILLNTIGGDSWAGSGEWIEWTFTVPRTGLYRLAFRAKQNLLSGASSSRKVYIDGEIPFREFAGLPFSYKNGWQIVSPDYLVALEAGEHTIRMEATTGALAEVISAVENSLAELNAAYRQIIMITGVTPDPYRDYMLDDLLPGVFETFRRQAGELGAASERLLEISGKRGSVNGTLDTVTRQLRRFAGKPEKVQKQLSDFKNNIGSLSTWLITVKGQSLSLDEIYLYGEGAKLPRREANIFSKIAYEARLFVNSFIFDYSVIGGGASGDVRLDVWIDSGRDQATILQELSADFVAETGIGVNIKLVSGQLLSATMAGRGPDIALNLTKDTPVNYAVRGAVVDLTQFESAEVPFSEVAARFRESAFVPLRLEGGVYGLPETQTFPVLYYRTDIFAELGLEPPETWRDLYKCLNVLQKNNMTVGIPAPSSAVGAADAMTSYLTLLYQHGGQLYTDDSKASALTSKEATDAFREWCSLYIDYNLELKFDAATRFRSGEMPLILSDFTLYNNLSIAAPEIRGLWSIAPVPGTAGEDGVVRHDAPAFGNSCVMMSACTEREAAWSFLEWWTRAETQVAFGREMENRLGESARYPSANVEAFASMSWPVADLAILQEQWGSVHGVPEVPGGYFTSRHLNNAFRRVLYYNEDPQETLIRYTRFIDREIEQKRRELGLAN